MHLFGHNLDHDYYFELPRAEGAGYPINYSMFDFTPSPVPGFPACEPNFVNFPKSHSLRIIQYKRTASFRAMATLAIFRPRLIVRWTCWLRHSGRLRVFTGAASTS
jgi:hypothetical protein